MLDVSRLSVNPTSCSSDECDLKRENVDARLGLLGDGSENLIPFDHSRFGELYRSEVKKLVTALRINPKSDRNPRRLP